MEKIKILVVEDERITAEDIRYSLMNLGYEVTALVSSGTAATKEVEKHQPDLVLMDIVLQGEMDGIAAASKIRSRFDIPIIYTTAYSDESTLERVKKTEPLGYILKPFEDQELKGVIEVALYKHNMEKKLKENEEQFRSLYETMTLGVIYMDARGEITSVNPAAESILKMNTDEIKRQWSHQYNLKAFHEDGTEFITKELPLAQAFKTGKQIHNIIFGIVHPEGGEYIWIKASAVPQYKPGEKKPYQTYITFDDITERKRSEDALLNYAAQLNALRKIAQGLTGLRDLDTLLKHILESGVQILGGLGGGIYLYHPETDSLEYAVAVNIERKYVDLVMRRGEGLAGKVLETGQPLIIQDYANWPGRSKQMSDYSASMVAVPIRQEREFLGVLSVRVGDPGKQVTSESTELLSQFATQAAIAIQNARLFKEERLRTSQIAAIAMVAEKINSILRLEELLKETVQMIVDTFGYYYATIMLMDEKTNELVFYTGAGGFAGKTPAGFRQNMKEGMIGWAAYSGETILANDVSKEPRYLSVHLSETNSELDVPIIYREKVIGVLDIRSKETNIFGEEDVRTMETLARHIAVAIENARLYEKAQHEITQRKQAEANIRQQTEAMEASMDGMAILNNKEEYVYLNQSHVKKYGYKRARELIGKTWRVLYKEDEIRRFEKHIFPKFKKQGHWRGEAVGRRKDGSCFDQEVSLTALKDGGLVCVVRDITERKQAEITLKESEECYRTIFNGSKDAIFITGENTKFVDVNAAASALTGYTRKTLLTMGITELHDSEDLHAFKAYFRRIMDGESIDSEADIRRKDGKKIPVEFSNKRISIRGVPHMHTTARDVSQRKLAEENIRQQMRAMETSMDGMAILNDKEEYIYLNKAHANVYGYDRTEELLGKTWRVLYGRDEIQRFEKTIFPKLRQEGHWRGEAVGKRRDATLFHQEVSLSALEEGGLVYIVRDVTERKKVEEGLYESEGRLQTTFDSMGDAIHVVNKDMKIILHNKRFFDWNRQLGLEEDMEGKNLFDVFPFLSQKIRGEYRYVFKTGETLITEENNVLGDKEIFTETRKIPVFDHDTVLRVITVIRDISESHRIVQELIVSEERFRSLFENATIGIYRTTPDGQIVMANPALIRLLGYNSYSELANRNLEKEGFEPAYSRNTFKKTIEETGEIQGLETTWKKKDGTSIHIRESAKAFRDKKGNLLYYEGTVEDITKRKQAEDALRESENILVQMTNSISEAVVFMDGDGKITFWNSSAEKLFGYSKKEAIGKEAAELLAFDKEYSAVFKKGLSIFKKTGSGKAVGKALEFQALKKDGTSFLMEASVSIVKSRDQWWAIGIIRDITERKAAEEALRESEERYRGVVEDQTELICRFTSDKTLTFVNKAYCDYFGKNRDELIGQRFMPLIPVEDQKRVEINLNTLARNKPLVSHEHRVIKKDNTLGWLRWTNRAFFKENDDPIEIQAVGHDITSRKRTEERLKELLQEKEVLLKEVYHRVKNNFQVVTSLLNLQARNIKNKATHQIFMESRDRVRTMAMVHERLYQSKDLSKLQFAEYIQTLADSLIRSYATGSKKVKLNTDIEDIPLNIDQAIPCGLVLNELISNVLKYAFPDGWKGKSELFITFKKKPKNKIELVVGDNGVGLPRDFVLEDTESLGLHLVQILVEDQLHGTVQLDRRGGTKFQILFTKS